MLPRWGLGFGDDALRCPISRQDYQESDLIGLGELFLSVDQQNALCTWWLIYRRGAKLPTWDLVVTASDQRDRPALVLVEAKAHASELSTSAKPTLQRKTRDQQKRSDGNHKRIGEAIAQANAALSKTVPGISLSQDKSYQFANRVAFAWKLASLGVPVALIYLGFIGDLMISGIDDCFQTSTSWRNSFEEHTKEHFPHEQLERAIDCGSAPFWLLIRELQVVKCSPPLEARRRLVDP